ncbi:uncharacterized protein LOC111257403 [Setaria italica]|uniref:uncharacterized protein LOC111257403 n=1 Tax=Setaria italica TaxID=4555 RepID=UPI000BE4C48D|nr:uncharacterized protein LOC111257403 [Setaria italica]
MAVGHRPASHEHRNKDRNGHVAILPTTTPLATARDHVGPGVSCIARRSGRHGWVVLSVDLQCCDGRHGQHQPRRRSAGRPAARHVRLGKRRPVDTIMDVDDDDDVFCAYCSVQRALLHCAQHGARLCLHCDVRVHAAAPCHERAPLCYGCQAAPADEHCTRSGPHTRPVLLTTRQKRTTTSVFP